MCSEMIKRKTKSKLKLYTSGFKIDRDDDTLNQAIVMNLKENLP